MARRRTPVTTEDGDVMPRHLVDPKQISAGECREVIRERNAWLRARGINPGDWNQFRAAMREARTAYDIPDALERTRRRLQVADTTEDRR